MPIAINYKNTSNKKNSSNIVLFVDEKFNISGLKKYKQSNNSFLNNIFFIEK